MVFRIVLHGVVFPRSVVFLELLLDRVRQVAQARENHPQQISEKKVEEWWLKLKEEAAP